MDLAGRDWWVETQFAVLYKGNPDTLTLILKKEEDAKGGRKWVAAGADADFLCLPKVEDSVFVPPNSADTDFLSLREVMRRPGQSAAILPRERTFDPLSAFLFAHQQGDIELIYTLHRRLHILTVPNWVLTVEYEPRNRMNSGWLIYDLFPVSDKNAYRQSILHLSDDHQ